MYLSKGRDNTVKNGRVWLYLTEKYNQSIGVEWSLRFNPFNVNFESDGSERRYLITFWFIWVFYISFENIFKTYPKEWNSQSNNKKGGYLDSATRRIGISQYGWTNISLYFWHDGESPWYGKDKCNKIWHKTIWLDSIFAGSYKFHTLDELENYEVEIELTEDIYKVKMNYRFTEKRYKRFYMRPFWYRTKYVHFQENDIIYPITKLLEEDKADLEKYGQEHLERRMERKSFNLPLEVEDVIDYSCKEYTEYVLEKRSVENRDWVPYKYREYYYREKKLKRVLKNVNR